MTPDRIANWTLLAIFAIVALIALVFSCLAYSECNNNQPSKNLTRRDLHVVGDLLVDGETQLEGTVVMDDTLTVRQSTKLSKLFLNSFQFLNYQAITATGSAILYSDKACYRVDTPTGTVDLQLPLVSQVPGMIYWVMKSQTGRASTVTINVGTGDQFCSGSSPTSSNPVYTLLSNQVDQAMITNDGVNTWFALAHT